MPINPSSFENNKRSLSLQEIRRILGKKAEGMSDEEMEHIRFTARGLAEIILDLFEKQNRGTYNDQKSKDR